MTVVGVCAAFDVFVNWDSIHRTLWGRERDGCVVVSSEKTAVSDAPLQQTRFSRTSTNGNSRVSHINGLSVTSAAQRTDTHSNTSSELRELILRIGKNNFSLSTPHKLSLHLSVSADQWSGSGVVQDVHELWFPPSLQALRDAGYLPSRQICQASAHSRPHVPLSRALSVQDAEFQQPLCPQCVAVALSIWSLLRLVPGVCPSRHVPQRPPKPLLSGSLPLSVSSPPAHPSLQQVAASACV